MRGGVAQMVERSLSMQEARGLIPRLSSFAPSQSEIVIPGSSIRVPGHARSFAPSHRVRVPGRSVPGGAKDRDHASDLVRDSARDSDLKRYHKRRTGTASVAAALAAADKWSR